MDEQPQGRQRDRWCRAEQSRKTLWTQDFSKNSEQADDGTTNQKSEN
jgi:hypothetical protein